MTTSPPRTVIYDPLRSPQARGRAVVNLWRGQADRRLLMACMSEAESEWQRAGHTGAGLDYYLWVRRRGYQLYREHGEPGAYGPEFNGREGTDGAGIGDGDTDPTPLDDLIP